MLNEHIPAWCDKSPPLPPIPGSGGGEHWDVVGGNSDHDTSWDGVGPGHHGAGTTFRGKLFFEHHGIFGGGGSCPTGGVIPGTPARIDFIPGTRNVDVFPGTLEFGGVPGAPGTSGVDGTHDSTATTSYDDHRTWWGGSSFGNDNGLEWTNHHHPRPATHDEKLSSASSGSTNDQGHSGSWWSDFTMSSFFQHDNARRTM